MKHHIRRPHLTKKQKSRAVIMYLSGRHENHIAAHFDREHIAIHHAILTSGFHNKKRNTSRLP